MPPPSSTRSRCRHHYRRACPHCTVPRMQPPRTCRVGSAITCASSRQCDASRPGCSKYLLSKIDLVILAPTSLLTSPAMPPSTAPHRRRRIAVAAAPQWKMAEDDSSKVDYFVVHLTVFVCTLQHFTAFYSIYSILQHFTAFYSICTFLQHFTAFYSNLQYLYVLTAFYSICTYFTAFYSILQHLYVHTCSCWREARSWDMH